MKRSSFTSRPPIVSPVGSASGPRPGCISIRKSSLGCISSSGSSDELRAMPAVAFEQDLSDLADHAFLGGGGMFDADAAAGQARDLAAINADEVRMLAGYIAGGSPQF